MNNTVGSEREPEGGVHSPIRFRAIEDAEFPLWDREEYLGDEAEWFEENLKLAPDTLAQLRQWQVDFLSWADDGRNIEEGTALHDRAARLVARIQHELPPSHQVVLDTDFIDP